MREVRKSLYCFQLIAMFYSVFSLSFSAKLLTRQRGPLTTMLSRSLRFSPNFSLFRTRKEVRMLTMTGREIDLSSTPVRMKVKKIIEADESSIGKVIKLQGWVRTIRDQKKFAFIEVNDGSSLTGMQAVADSTIDSYDEVSKLSTGSSVEIIGEIIASIGKGNLIPLLRYRIIHSL